MPLPSELRPVRTAEIERLIDAKGWNLVDLAKQAALDPRTIRTLMRRGTARIDTIASIAKVLNISIEKLLEQIAPPRSEVDQLIDIAIRFFGSLSDSEKIAITTVIQMLAAKLPDAVTLLANGPPRSGSVIVSLMADEGAVVAIARALAIGELRELGAYQLMFSAKRPISLRILRSLQEDNDLADSVGVRAREIESELFDKQSFDGWIVTANVQLKVEIAAIEDEHSWSLSGYPMPNNGLFAAKTEKKTASQYAPSPRLSPTERQILAMLLEGTPSDEIALQMSLTTYSVTAYLARIFKKFKVSNAGRPHRCNLQISQVRY